MKSKIFTFLTLLFCTAVGMAQPLSGSPLPDTITEKNTNGGAGIKNFSQLIYQYHDDGRKKEVKTLLWVDSLSSFIYSQDSIFVYLPNKKIAKVTIGDREITYKYNYREQDSLIETRQISNDSIIELSTFEYTSEGKLSKTKVQNDNSIYENYYDENKYLFKYIGLNNGNVSVVAKHNYYYQNNKISSFTLQQAYGQDTTNFKWIAKNEWYYDLDNQLDEQHYYQFNQTQNEWVLTGKSKHKYLENEHIILTGLDLDNPTRKATLSYNSTKQIIENKIEVFYNELNDFKVTFREASNYRADGSLKYSEVYYANEFDLSSNLSINRAKLYGYKTPDISSNNDLYSEENLSIYPNPATHFIYVSEPGNNIHKFHIIDIKGNVVQQRENNTDHILIERNGMPAGLYYIQIQTEKGTVTKPIIWVD